MTAKTLTIELTEAQYRALSSAVALASAAYEDQGGQDATTELATLNRAWSKIREAVASG